MTASEGTVDRALGVGGFRVGATTGGDLIQHIERRQYVAFAIPDSSWMDRPRHSADLTNAPGIELDLR
jgi:hypothetical protein